MDRRLDLGEQRAELEVRGRVVDRVGPEAHQRLDLAAFDRCREALDRSDVALQLRGQRRVGNRLADGAERLVDRVRDCVRCGRLARTDDDGAVAAGVLEVLGDRGDAVVARLEAVQRGAEVVACAHAEFGRELKQRCRDVLCLASEAVVGDRARRRVARLEHVEARHRFASLRRAAAIAPRLGVAEVVAVRREEVAVERHDDVGLREVEVRLDCLAERRHGTRGGFVTVQRIPRVDLRLREHGLQLLDHAELRRRRGRLGQDVEASAAIARGECFACCVPERIEGLDAEVRIDGLVLVAVAVVRRVVHGHARELRGTAATRIVDLEQFSLQASVARAEAARVLRVAFDLRRTTVVALHQDADAVARARQCRRVELRRAGLEAFGALVERQDLGDGLAAAREAGERHRSGDGGQEAAARDVVGDDLFTRFRDALRELAFDELLELGRVLELLEAAPVGHAGGLRTARGDVVAHRWQAEQWVGGFSSPRVRRSLAEAIDASLGCQAMSVAFTSLGRTCVSGLRWHSRHQPMLSGST